jgi:colicin import membrane protein
MNKVYLLAPLLALLAFVGVYSAHRSGMQDREQAKAAAAAAALQTRLDAETAARKLAMAEAIKAAELRKEEKAAKEAREKAEKAARQTALDERDKAFREQEKLSRQIERITKDIEAEQTTLAKIAAERLAAESERAFLHTFAAKARENAQSLQSVLTGPAAAPATAAAAK